MDIVSDELEILKVRYEEAVRLLQYTIDKAGRIQKSSWWMGISSITIALPIGYFAQGVYTEIRGVSDSFLMLVASFVLLFGCGIFLIILGVFIMNALNIGVEHTPSSETVQESSSLSAFYKRVLGDGDSPNSEKGLFFTFEENFRILERVEIYKRNAIIVLMVGLGLVPVGGIYFLFDKF